MSERKLASIQRILSLSPIEGADKIEKATVLGWEVVVAKKDNLKVDDLIVYCEIDSILPDRAEFDFLRERKFRIKTIKLKGQVSQGIIFPLSILPKGKYSEGSDVTEILGVRKYDPQAEFERKEADRLASIDKNRMSKFMKRFAWYRKWVFKPSRLPFPAFIKKTDEDRIQLFPNACKDWRDIEFTATEKIDGQSATYFCIPNPRKGLFQPNYLFGVCSRNFQLLKPDNSSYWTIANRLSIKDKLISYCKEWGCGIIIQGEIIGTKIQGNKYGVNDYHFYVFNVKEYYRGETTDKNYAGQLCFCKEYGFMPVQFIGYINLPDTISEVVDLAKGYSILKDIPREGLVLRNYEKGISFKVINPDFLLKYDS